MEDRFNKKFQYPWVFLNEEPFSDEFKRYICCTKSMWLQSHRLHSWTTELTGSSTQYGLISREQWVQPDWIDEKKASKAREEMAANRVIYGGTQANLVFSSFIQRTEYQTVSRVSFYSSAAFFSKLTWLSYRNMCRYNSGVSIVAARRL